MIDNHNEITFSHDLYKETIFNTLSNDRKIEIHKKFTRLMQPKIHGSSINNLAKLLNHSLHSQEFAIAFIAAARLVEKSTNHFMPDIAQDALSHLSGILTKYKIRPLRMVKIGILGSKVYLLQGSIAQAKDYISLIRDYIDNINIPSEVYINALSVLSFYYWTAGDLDTAKKFIEKLLSLKEISPNQEALFVFRMAGVLSDGGYFKESNNHIENYLNNNKIDQPKINILGSEYQILPAILAIKARNLSYLGEMDDFHSLAEYIQSILKNDFSLSDILARCFIADAYLAAQNYRKALDISSDAARIANKNNLTTLNPFIFTILGFSKCMLGDKTGLHFIHKSIQAAELDKRYSRLGLYYLYYMKASKKISPSLTHTRYKKRALSLAQKNGERWIENELKIL